MCQNSYIISISVPSVLHHGKDDEENEANHDLSLRRLPMACEAQNLKLITSERFSKARKGQILNSSQQNV